MEDKMARFESEDKKNYWKTKLEEFDRSGLTQADFCQTHELKYYQFKYWNERLRVLSEPKSDFALVKVPKETKPNTMTLILASGIKIEFGVVPEVTWIKNLISTTR